MIPISYIKKIEYKIVPNESFTVIRNCSGCGRKTHFKNTKRFRVNANGNKLDIWLIYQCENCKHTLNLTIYERQKVTSVTKDDYRCFLHNDEQLAEEYSRDLMFFKKNKAEVDIEESNYRFVKMEEIIDKNDCTDQILITIHNPYRLKLRIEKQIAEILALSRSQVKKLMEQEEIKTEMISLQSISIYVNRHLYDDRGQPNGNKSN